MLKSEAVSIWLKEDWCMVYTFYDFLKELQMLGVKIQENA